MLLGQAVALLVLPVHLHVHGSESQARHIDKNLNHKGDMKMLEINVEVDVSPQPLVQRHRFCRHDGTERLRRCISDTLFLHRAAKPPEPNPAPH